MKGRTENGLGRSKKAYPNQWLIIEALEAHTQENDIGEIRGIGGTEYVYEKYIDSLKVGLKELAQFKI